MDEQDVTLELQAPAWAKGPYGPAPEGWERSSAPFRAKDEIEFLRNRLAVIEKQRDDLLALLRDDAYAMTFQSLGQYRSAVIKAAIAMAKGEVK